MNKIAYAALLLGVGLLVGCDPTPRARYGSLGLLEVSGVVTMDGSPLTNAVVVFQDVDTRKFSYAMTNSSGEYQLQFDSQSSGIMKGTKVVEISMTRKIPGLNGQEEEVAEEGKRPANGKPSGETVPECYNAKSQLTVEVDGSTSTYNFDLKKDGSTTGPS